MLKAYRMFFSKTGRAKYISHLDLVRCLTRTFYKTGIPVWHTQGYNPRIYMSFPLPLSLGFVGLRESFDFRLEDDEFDPNAVRELMNQQLPEGLFFERVSQPLDDPMRIAWAAYHIYIELSIPPEQLESRVKEYFTQKEILCLKKSKQQEKVIDIAPHMQLRALETYNNELRIDLLMAAGNTLNLNPALFIGSLESFLGEELKQSFVERYDVLKDDFTSFV